MVLFICGLGWIGWMDESPGWVRYKSRHQNNKGKWFPQLTCKRPKPAFAGRFSCFPVLLLLANSPVLIFTCFSFFLLSADSPVQTALATVSKCELTFEPGSNLPATELIKRELWKSSRKKTLESLQKKYLAIFLQKNLF